MKKIVYLPLDERPCNAKFPAKLLAENPEFVLRTAPEEILGDKKTPAAFADLAAFLGRECRDADYLVLSVDTLLYGGLLPSRLHSLTPEELGARHSLIGELRRASPRLKIFAFQTVMRCPQYSSDDEEPDYYGKCGKEIFLVGEARDRRGLGLDYDAESLAAREALVAPYLADYLGRRAVNLEMLRATIGLVGTAIDYLVIPQDDSAVYGWTAKDQRTVRGWVKASGRRLEIPVYPGSDEVGLTLIARCVNDAHGPLRARVIWSSAAGPSLIPLYEDRPIGETVKYQLTAAGCVLTEDADFTLMVNAPSGGMIAAGGAGGARHYETERTLDEFAVNLAYRVGRGEAAAVADVAYVNGGDIELAALIGRLGLTFRLAAYAGWNTSSNTLGTAIAQAVVYCRYGDTAAHRRFLALRYCEDLGYCAYARRALCEEYLPARGLGYFDAGGREGATAREAGRRIAAWIGGLLPEVASRYRIARVRQPWARMFETDLDLIEKEDGL